MPRIIVLGSLNLDELWSVARLPAPGETVLAKSIRREFGGKGANQAVAAARQGAEVIFVGAVGADPGGQEYLQHLKHEGIDPRHVRIAAGSQTGTAHVYVDEQGENLIVVHGGANDALTPEFVAASIDGIENGACLVLQLECPLPAMLAGLRAAARRGLRCILNASPAPLNFPWAETSIDVLIVNEHECLAVFGHAPEAFITASPSERAALLRQRAVNDLVITRGGEATVHVSAAELAQVPTHPVSPIDTVGAGDAFVGILATRLAEGVSWPEAIRKANVGAALATLKPGAQSGMPSRLELETAARMSTR